MTHHPSLTMNLTRVEVSKVLETQQSHIPDNILPLEESKSNVQVMKSSPNVKTGSIATIKI